MFLVRISVNKIAGGRVFFSFFFLRSFYYYQLNTFFTNCYSPPWDKVKLNTNLAYFHTCFKQRDPAS